MRLSHKYILASLLLLLTAVLFYFLLPYTESLENQSKFGPIPKIIWSYWDTPDTVPKTVKMCMDSWKRHCPDYEIRLLNKTSLSQYIDIPERLLSHPNFNDSIARFSDLVRLWTLAKHGGVWVDSTILFSAPLELSPTVEYSGYYLKLFTTRPEYPVVESWFIACTPGSPFVQKWRDEFAELASFPSVDDYISSRKKMGVDFQKIDYINYLAIHIASQKILQVDKYPKDSLELKAAEDGPYRYLVAGDWNPEKAVNMAVKDKSLRYPMMKMRSHERKIVESENIQFPE